MLDLDLPGLNIALLAALVQLRSLAALVQLRSVANSGIPCRERAALIEP
jgi:hypothetical protein